MKFTFEKDYSTTIGVGGITGIRTKSYKKGDIVEGEPFPLALGGKYKSIRVNLYGPEVRLIQGAQEYIDVPFEYFAEYLLPMPGASTAMKTKTPWINPLELGLIGFVVAVIFGIVLYFKLRKK
jgi:hypothetical protein